MKNLKKLDRKSLKNLNGGSGFCNLNCKINETCGIGCGGWPICVPKGEYIPEPC